MHNSRKSSSPRRSARRICRWCRSASRQSASRSCASSISAISRICSICCRGFRFRAPTTPVLVSRRCTCAASRAVVMAIIRARRRAWACTSMSSRSPPSRVRSISTSTTSRGSRRWRVRRARCTAQARRPAPSASSPTSPRSASFRPPMALMRMRSTVARPVISERASSISRSTRKPPCDSSVGRSTMVAISTIGAAHAPIAG